MADPLLPHDIARRTFDTVRRGYEQQEVRGFLHEVAALLERLTRSETELRERALRAEARLGDAEHPDEAVLLEVLGAETTRVLTSAREAAAEIRAKAEASVERIIADATSEAAEVRSKAVHEAEALLGKTKADSESLLEQARSELARRSAEAEEAAALIRAEGEKDAQNLREEGQAALGQARAEAEAAIEAARQQGKDMVAEAQAVRERVLRDLAVRRKRARQQVEKLNAGRERLLQAYAVVRRTIDEASDELNVSLGDARAAGNAAARRIEEEPETTLEQLDAEIAAAALIDLPITELDDDRDDDRVDDRVDGLGGGDQDLGDHDEDDDGGPGPLSGEVPVVSISVDTSPEPSGGGASAEELAELPWPSSEGDRRGRRSRRRKGFEGLPPGELTVVAPPNADEGVRILPAPDEPVAPSESAASEVVAPPPEVAEVTQPEPVVAEPSAPEPVVAEVLEPAPAAEPAPEQEQEPEPEPEPERDGALHEDEVAAADDVFARLRAQNEAPADGDTDPEAAAEEEGAAVSAPSSAEEQQLLARAKAVAPLEKELSRRLKRALADEQNEVLDLLRRGKPKGVDDLLPDPDLHASRWADAVESTLGESAAAGASATGGTATSVVDLADELARSLTAPLRERIDRSFAASDGNLDDVADRVRALYREWKGQRLSETAQHYSSAAYARGVFDAIASGSQVHWVIDPSVGPCPDCDDNVLAGSLTKGDEFPTGNACAPAHPGCHCLVLAVPS